MRYSNVLVRAICRYALERDQIAMNPTSNLRLPAANGRRERAFSPQQVAAQIEAVPPVDQPLWWCAALAGLRRGELRALRWQDIDLSENVITVERSWDDIEGAISPKERKGQAAGAGAAFAAPGAARPQVARRPRWRRPRFQPFGLGALHSLCRARAKKAWAAAAVGAFLRGEQAEPLEFIGLHELRHSYVSQLHAAGFSLEEIGDYVGHRSAWMTDRYGICSKGTKPRQPSALRPTSCAQESRVRAGETEVQEAPTAAEASSNVLTCAG